MIFMNSYEGLPPNFSLSANMLAGAFAGIAVSSPFARVYGCARSYKNNEGKHKCAGWMDGWRRGIGFMRKDVMTDET